MSQKEAENTLDTRRCSKAAEKVAKNSRDVEAFYTEEGTPFSSKEALRGGRSDQSGRHCWLKKKFRSTWKERWETNRKWISSGFSL